MEQEDVVIDDDFIREYSADEKVIRFIQNKFKRLSTDGAVNLITLLINGTNPIKADRIIKKNKSFLHYNMAKFNNNNELKLEVLKDLRLLLNEHLRQIGKDIISYDEERHKLHLIQKFNEQYFILDKNTLYKKVRALACDEIGNIIFKYNFLEPDMKISTPENKNTLQHSNIQISSKPIKFDYPIQYSYRCVQCGLVTTHKSYQTISTNTKIKCGGVETYLNSDGEPRSRRCMTTLYPDGEISITKDAYFYDISYEDEEGEKHNAGAISFIKYMPGFYECALFRIRNPKKTELYQIMDVREINPNIFKLPKQNDNENYLFTLQKQMDEFILKQTGMEIYGLIPMKLALIIQKMFQVLGQKLIANMQIVGDASTGKSTIVRYYSYLLNNHLNLNTNGMSISVPALRGTKHTISLMGKEQKIITSGQLGSFHTIYIDEAGEDKELVKHLKTFLMEENYSYNKAGTDGIFRKRTTHINLTENLEYAHLGQYRGGIKKDYKSLTIKIGDEEKPEWCEDWDLHKALYKYDNLYLRKVISDKRIEYKQKQVFWIDGYDYALHERFPFYFYLVNEKHINELFSIIKGNVNRNTIGENLELIRALKNNELNMFFDDLKKYLNSEDDIKSFEKADNIFENYGLLFDARTRIFYYNILKMSRIINKRYEIIDMDYDLLKFFLEKTNCKLDVSETIDYDITGPPNIKEFNEVNKKIEDTSREEEDIFGMPEDEFS